MIRTILADVVIKLGDETLTLNDQAVSLIAFLAILLFLVVVIKL